MCYVLDPELLLVNLFHVDKKPLTIKRLKEVRQEIETEIPSLFVDISMNSVCFAIERRPEMFRWSGERICMAENTEDMYSEDKLNKYFNWKIPSNIRSNFLKIIATFL